jgi:hypothetical protein
MARRLSIFSDHVSINSLTSDLSSGHNLCFEYPSGSYKPILDIEIPRTFQWYKELFNPMSFDHCDYPLKIRESIEILTPKVGAHLRVWGSLLHTLLHTRNMKCDSQVLFLTHTFASPCLGREPKAKVATTYNHKIKFQLFRSLSQL